MIGLKLLIEIKNPQIRSRSEFKLARLVTPCDETKEMIQGLKNHIHGDKTIDHIFDPLDMIVLSL